MLGTLDQDNKSRWPEHLSPLVYAYNCTRHSTTGFSPFLLMFGREPHLPIDVALGVNSVSSGSGSYPAYIANLRDRLSVAYQKVIEESMKSAARNKQSYAYDSRARQTSIQVGDVVLVRNLSIRGKHKLADRWEEDPYRVVECIPGLPVYKVQDKDGKERVLHRNLLLSFRGPPSAPAASPQPVRTKQSLQSKSPTEDSCDLDIIIEDDIDDESYTELVPISASKPLNPEVADFQPPHVEMPAAVENPEVDGDEMENPMQTDSQQGHPDPVVPGTDQQCAAGYPVVPNSGLPLSDSDECPTEVTHSESGPNVAEADPVQDPPYVTRTGRTSKPP